MCGPHAGVVGGSEYAQTHEFSALERAPYATSHVQFSFTTVVKERGLAVKGPERDLDSLLREVAIGDETAFEAFYGATVDRCFALVRSVLADRAWAEDCVADVFTQVWRNAAEFDPNKGSAMAWLLMIARTRAIDLLRRERRHRALPLSPSDSEDEPVATPDHHFGGLLAVGRLKNALSSLSRVQKHMLELAFFNDLSHGEIARATGIPIGTVKSHLRRALGLLKQELVVADEIQG